MTLLTKKEACSVLHVSLSKLNSMLTKGELPFVKIGGCVRFSPDALQDVIARHTLLNIINTER